MLVFSFTIVARAAWRRQMNCLSEVKEIDREEQCERENKMTARLWAALTSPSGHRGRLSEEAGTPIDVVRAPLTEDIDRTLARGTSRAASSVRVSHFLASSSPHGDSRSISRTGCASGPRATSPQRAADEATRTALPEQAKQLLAVRCMRKSPGPEQVPVAGDAFQDVATAIGEAQSGSGD